MEDLVGWEFRGYNPPALARALGIGKFVKGFLRRDGEAEGYNVWCSQRDWRRLRFRGRELRHGWYLVRPAPAPHRGLVLDYGASPRNGRLNPERLLRDVLVHPDPADRDLLLGRAYLALGRPVPVSFFVLERDREAESCC